MSPPLTQEKEGSERLGHTAVGSPAPKLHPLPLSGLEPRLRVGVGGSSYMPTIISQNAFLLRI